MNFNDIVNLDLYPFHNRDSDDYTALIARLKYQLDDEQICTLPNFLIPQCREDEIQSVNGYLHLANPARSFRNVYLERERSEDLPDTHPKNILSEASYNMVGAHILSNESALKKLYYWDCFQEFVADIVGITQLHPSADPYQPVNVLCHEPGDKSAWHFDSSNSFTMTLMLQAPESGGQFELVPNIRSDDAPHYDRLSKMLLGDHTKVKSYERDEGSLVIFRGCHSAHRVTEIKGNTNRLMCVMVYEDRPGVIGDPVVNETVYGIAHNPD